MLQSMLQQGTPAPSGGPPTFAGMLAAFAAPAQKRPVAWNDDDLADDVATLSYERALNAHARYKTPELGDRSGLGPVNAGGVAGVLVDEVLFDEVLADDKDQPVPPFVAPITATKASTQPAYEATAAEEPTLARRNLKTASITIRLSKAECAQLRKRAAEAGLTVSAYLRSCTFEAESLRAMVKDTLAQLRSKSAQKSQANSAPARRGWLQWLARFWPLARPARGRGQGLGQHPAQHAARA
ncbi:MAG: hypothetical protein ABSF53_06875 [Terracidiphilus sp.]